MNALAQAAAVAHHRALENLSGVSAVYRRHDTNDAIELTLVPGRSEVESYDTEDETLSARQGDWLILKEDLLDLIHRAPEDNDEIDIEPQEGFGDETDRQTFRVSRAGFSRVWEYTDHHRTQVRIHSIQIHAENE